MQSDHNRDPLLSGPGPDDNLGVCVHIARIVVVLCGAATCLQYYSQHWACSVVYTQSVVD